MMIEYKLTFQTTKKLQYCPPLTIVFDVLCFPEVDQAWGAPETVLLGHESVIHLDQLDAVLCRLIVDLLQYPQHLGTLVVLIVDCTVLKLSLL